MVNEFLKIIVHHVGRTLNVLVVKSCLTSIEGISLRVVVIVMTFLVCVYRTDLIFSKLFIIFYLGLITTPHVLYVHMTYVYAHFLMFHSSHDYVAKRSHYRIMIFYMTFGVLLYGRTLTLIFFYFLHNPTTPILPVYVDQQWPHLEKDTTRTRGMILRQLPTVPGRTPVTPD